MRLFGDLHADDVVGTMLAVLGRTPDDGGAAALATNDWAAVDDRLGGNVKERGCAGEGHTERLGNVLRMPA